MISHNELGKDWTARHRPWRLIFQKEFELKSDAIALEKWLKSGSGRSYIKTLPY
jgi:putative endonuclease